MTAPTVNGVKYPQPVDALLPAARALAEQLGEVPSRNRLMKEFAIGAPKATELRERLVDEPPADPWLYAEPVGPDPVPAPPVPESAPPILADPQPAEVADTVEPDVQPTTDGHPGTPTAEKSVKPLPVWPVWLLMLPAFVAVWAGWVELGKLTGFGPVDLLPGFTRDNGEPLLTLNTAITLPIGMEVYAGYALFAWLSGRTTRRARTFAMASALIALTLGAGAQITYHLLAAPETGTPWQITTVVACLPVAVLGMGAALAHLVREDH
ncbi:ABC transporter permease [Verrucosispora sp. WMMD1129]|uniref:ABC transporter permease n=1 Tax=Verrucosispora sp. WMMD1129 TaxID=3016093 RepID=UPI00249A8F12|nr:ABC transporter permease [Verrucosispora sp. WMMD1129]WFE44999.1 ABC transporter permease [Verrucosispora sp. WMMD1129]WFE46291.1 ABC transporter permease [Verrucosispora sp. WMMD1129]